MKSRCLPPRPRLLPLCPLPAFPVDYDIIYVRSPSPDDTTRIDIPEVKDPIRVPPDTDLMLLRPDGTEECPSRGRQRRHRRPDALLRRTLGLLHSKFHDQRPLRAGPPALRETRRAPGPTSTSSTCRLARSSASPTRSGLPTPASPTGRATTSTTNPASPTTSATASSTSARARSPAAR